MTTATNAQLAEMLQRCVNTLRRYPAEGDLMTEAELLLGPLRRNYHVELQNAAFKSPYLTANCQHDGSCRVCSHFPKSVIAFIYDGSPEHNRHFIDATRFSRKRALMEGQIMDGGVTRQALYFDTGFVDVGDYLVRTPTEVDKGNPEFRRIPKVVFDLHFSLVA